MKTTKKVTALDILNPAKPMTFEQALKDSNNSANQKIKGQFIQRDVYCNVNSMVDYILKKSWDDREAPFSFDDIENLYQYPEYYGTYIDFKGGNQEQWEAVIAEIKEALEADDFTSQEVKEAAINDLEQLESMESEPVEIYEWWMVSSYLCEQLKAKGEPVIESENLWGRCTTGQAILLDYVISEICAGMEILQGQSNDWSK